MLKVNNEKQQIYTELKTVMAEQRILCNEPMSRHTTFKIGGPADYLVLPVSAQEVAAILRIAQEYALPVTVLGNGSNVLVLDKGIRGLVIKVNSEMSHITHQDTIIIAGAGASLSDVSRYAANHGLTGMEFAVGIPGSIGGAVYMNAGAYDGEMSHIVFAVTSVFPDSCMKRFTQSKIDFRYRYSIFQINNSIICEVELKLQYGDIEAIANKMTDCTTRRETKQPIEMPSAGSTFKRPPGYYAGTLIEQCGLKGLKIGGAQVSLKHAGFIINAGGATAKDVLALIKEVQTRVQDKYGVLLQPEVKVFGEE